MKQRPCSHCHGTGLVPDARMKISEVDRLLIVEKMRRGAKQRDLAAAYGISEGRISRLRHEAGLPDGRNPRKR